MDGSILRETELPPEKADHELVGRVVRWESETVFASVAALARALNVDRSTIYKVLRGDPSVKIPTLRKLERALGWPRDSIDAIARHDLEWLQANRFPAATLLQVRVAVETLRFPTDGRVTPNPDPVEVQE